ncbi:MAG: molybdopterin-binding/glycosyltransferase family 2 protein [Proteobacteria bacterium]|nr:molybdopterin-binding/glycosyltransferase family 2 protein [Pseudomonadota bacterium]
MLFERRPVEKTEQTILAHSIKLDKQTLKKGHVLSKADIKALQAAGYDSIVVASLEQDDVAEDTAAQLLANAVCGQLLQINDPFTGRCNLRAATSGLFIANSAGIDQLNLLHESLTIATLAAYSVVTANQLVATVKIIPFAVNRHNLDACLQVARQLSPLIHVKPFSAKKVGLIQTRLPATRESVLDKTSSVLVQRLQRLHSTLHDEIRCNHDETETAAAIDTLLESGADMIIIAGASAIVDRRDVVPSAIKIAAGDILHLGMPVDPGNLLLLARRGNHPILGLPGCARSPKQNGFDTVLERLVADIDVTPQDIMRMGQGGLLKEIITRPQLRTEKLNSVTQTAVNGPLQISALVLSTATSTRTGDINKLLLDIDGLPMVSHAVKAAIDSRATEVIVVTGHQHEQLSDVLRGYTLHIVHNPDYAQGMSTSLITGLKAVSANTDAVIVCLADMPRVTAEHINQLIAAFDPIEGRQICVPVYNGKRGNPVLWSQRFLNEMSELTGDVGAKQLIHEYSDVVCEVNMHDSAVLLDIDTISKD